MKKPPVGKRTIVCCRSCGMILLSQKSKNKGIGPGCERKEKRLQHIKPYIQETPYTEIGNRTHQIKIYSSLGDMF